MKKAKTFKRIVLTGMLTLGMILGLLHNVMIIAQAEEGSEIDAAFSLGEFNESTNKFEQATGSGNTVFYSMVIGFTLTKEDESENITLPTVDGFTYQDGISSDYSKIISMNPAKTASEIADYIKQVTVNGGSKGQEISVTLTTEEIKYRTFYWGGNGHFYQYVPITDSSVSDYTWMTAYNTAKAMEYNGRKGYLATVTSKEEDLFLFKASSKVGWLGGTRLTHTGDGDWRDWTFDTSDIYGTSWYWACGPEAGNEFYDVAKITSSTYSEVDSRNVGKGYYFNWERGGGSYLGFEPNSGASETCLATLTLSGGQGYATRNDVTGYSWNDLKNGQTSAGGNWDAKGFFVEYGNQINGDSSDSQSSASATTVSVGAAVEAPLPDWATNAGLDKEKVKWNARESRMELKQDVDLTDAITLPDGTDLTIDLNGSKLTGADEKPAIKAAGGSVNLKLQDSTGGGIVAGGQGTEGSNGGSAIDFSNVTGSSSIQLDNNLNVQGGDGFDAIRENENGTNGGDAIKGGSSLSVTVGGSIGETNVTGGKGGNGTGTGNGGDGGAGISGSGITITVGGDSTDKKGTVVGGAGGGFAGTGNGGNGGLGVNDSTSLTVNSGGQVVNGESGIRQHGHKWAYVGSDNEIAAYCIENDIAENCSYHGTEKAVKLILSATNTTYSGNANQATITDGISSVTGATVSNVVYYKSDGEGSTTIQGSALSGAPKDAGNYVAVCTVTHAGATGSPAEAKKAFTILPVAISENDVTLSSDSLEYNGSAQGPNVTVTVSGETLTKDTDYTLSDDVTATGVGSSYEITIQGIGNYNERINKTWKITPKAATVTVTDNSKTYGAADPTFDYSSSGVIDGEFLSDIRISRDAGEDVDTYTMRASQSEGANPNYNISFVDGTFTIGKADLTVTPDAGQFKAYGDSDPVLTYTVSGLKNSDTQSVLTGALTRDSGENRGEYEIAKGTLDAANYNITVTPGVNFAIQPKSITNASILLSDNELVYTGSERINSILSVVLGETILTISDYEVDASSQFSATAFGAYTVKINGKGNYKDSATVTWKIIDQYPPTGTIEMKENRWNTLWNGITFGILFKETQTVTITGADEGSGLDKIYYYVSNAELTVSEVAALADSEWTEGTTFPINPDNKYVIYAKITDKAGNVTYISSNGVILDATSPVISGVVDGKSYCETKIITVTDGNLDKVYVNDTEVVLTDSTYTLAADGTSYVIKAIDKAGNSTTVTVTVNASHSYGEWTTVTEPTCTEKGLKQKICAHCGTVAAEDIAATGHSSVTDVAVEATCTNTGLTEGSHCSECGEVIVSQESTEALGHDWSGAWKTVKEATEKEDGKKETVCTRGCGQKKVVLIPATGTSDALPEAVSGSLEKDAEVTPDAPLQDATLDNKKSELFASPAIFTAAEKAAITNGADAKVWIEVSKTAEGTIAATDKEKIKKEAEKIMGENPTLTYFDAELFKQVGDGEKIAISEPGIAIEMTISIPSDLLNHDKTMVREYKIIRLHTDEATGERKVDVLDGTFNEKTGEFTFKTDKFSTYAIAYNDTPVESSEDESNHTDTTNVSDNTDKKDSVPKTGDSHRNQEWYLLIMMVAGLGALYSGKKERKDLEEE